MNTDMTVGKPIRLILMFALPLFASNLFQQFYNLAELNDTPFLVGRSTITDKLPPVLVGSSGKDIQINS